MFRDKALHIAEKLLPAFNTPSGIPDANVNVASGVLCAFVSRELLLMLICIFLRRLEVIRVSSTSLNLEL